MSAQQLKLTAPLGYPKANAIRITAQISNVNLQFEDLSWEQSQKPEFSQKSTLGTFPILETPTGVISETNAILRYIARISPKTNLYGQSHFESGQVDQYLDIANFEIIPMQFALTAPILGWLEFNQGRYEKAKEDMQTLLKVLNEGLLLKTYFVGTQLTIADISLFAALSPLFKFILSPELRQQFSNLTRWYTNIASQPIFTQYFGKLHLAKSEWVLEGQELVQGQSQQQNSQVKSAKVEKQASKKQQAPKKETKKEAKKEEQAVEIPKKQGNPLDSLPPTDFNLFDFKTQIVNAKNKQESVQFMFDKLDRQGFSLYYMEYEKYEGEGVKLFLTSNLKDSILQRLDHFRKYSFGVHGVYGDEGNYDVFGVWLWRGKGHPQEIKDLPNYDYHKFRELNLDNEADRNLIMESWTGLEEDKSVVNGKIARDITLFK